MTRVRDFTTERERALCRGAKEFADLSKEYIYKPTKANLDYIKYGNEKYVYEIKGASKELEEAKFRTDEIFQRVEDLASKNIPEAFRVIREYDSECKNNPVLNYKADDMDRKADELSKIVEMLTASSLGGDTNSAIESIKKGNVKGTIFDTSLNFTATVAQLGYKDLAENSHAAYLDALNRMGTIGENGKYYPDLNKVLDILSKKAEKITPAEYYAASYAFCFMDEKGKEKVLESLLKEPKGVVVEIDGRSFTSYKNAETDEEKYKGLVAGMNKVLTINMLEIHAADDMDLMDGNYYVGYYLDVIRIQNLVQSAALLDAFGVVKSSNSYDKNEDSFIQLKCKEDGALILSYRDPIINNEQKIIVNACRTGAGQDFDNIEKINVKLSNYFAPGFEKTTFPDGSEHYSLKDDEALYNFLGNQAKDFLFGDYLDYRGDKLLENGLKRLPAEEAAELAGKTPLIKLGVKFAIDTQKKYRELAKNKEFIDDIKKVDETTKIYELFAIESCIVTYKTNEINGDYFFAVEGRDTAERVDCYNREIKELFKKESICFVDLIVDPEEIIKTLSDINETDNGLFLDELEMTGKGTGKDEK